MGRRISELVLTSAPGADALVEVTVTPGSTPASRAATLADAVSAGLPTANGQSVDGAKVSAHSVQFVRLGPLIVFAGTISLNDTLGTNDRLIDIPDGFFPSPSYIEVTVINSSTTAPCVVRVSPTTGHVTFRAGTAGSGHTLRVCGAYPG